MTATIVSEGRRQSGQVPANVMTDQPLHSAIAAFPEKFLKIFARTADK